MRRSDSVIILEKVALRRVIEKIVGWPAADEKDGCRVQQLWGCSLLPFQSRWKQPGKKRKKKKGESLKDKRTVSQVLERSLNPTVDGSDPRILGTTGKLQILQPVTVPTTVECNWNPAEGSPVYLGITPYPSLRGGMGGTEIHKRKEKKWKKY